MQAMVDVMGWGGAALVVGAYGLLSMKKLHSDDYAYHGMNIAGSCLLGGYGIAKHAEASVVVNAVWMLIGFSAIAAALKANR